MQPAASVLNWLRHRTRSNGLPLELLLKIAYKHPDDTHPLESAGGS